MGVQSLIAGRFLPSRATGRFGRRARRWYVAVLRAIRWRTPTEWLLTAACVGAGLLMFLVGFLEGALGLLSGLLLASEVIRRRGSAPAALVSAVAFGACSALSAATHAGLLLSLLNTAAVTLPLHRAAFPSLLLSQTFLVAYVAAFVAADVGRTGTLQWFQLLINVVMFNVIAGAAIDLASRRRRVELVLVDQVRETEDLALTLQRAEVLRRAIMAVRDGEAEETVVARLAQATRRLIGADVVQVLVAPRDGTTRPPKKAVGEAPELSSSMRVFPSRTPRPGGIVRQVLDRREPLWAKGLARADLVELQLPPTVSVVGLVPVVVSGGVYGILELARAGAREFDRSECELATALAEPAGIALERAVLRAELDQRVEGAETLHRIAAGLAGRRDIQEIAEDVVSALQTLYRADAAVFYLEGEDCSAEPLIAHGLSPSEFAELRCEYTGRRRGVQLRKGRALVMSNADDDRRTGTRTILSALGMATVVDVPVVSRERMIGGLVLCHHERRVYRPPELDLLETFAHQLGGGIELAQAYEAERALDREREEFLALVSHDLRQPAAAISIVAEGLAKSKQLSPLERDALDGLREQARSLSVFAEDVLSISQLESGALKLAPTSFDLAHLATALARQAPEADRIEVQAPDAPVQVRADATRIGRAVDNLLRNAVAYSPPGTPVVVRVGRTETHATLEVIDRGVGFEPAEAACLFQKYSRLAGARRGGPVGFGLGLYLARLMVEAHGGAITAETEGPGSGARFCILLPLTGPAP